MRTPTIAAAVVILALAGCSSEKTQTAYVGPAAMDAEEIQQLLHNRGFSNVTHLHKNGNDWVGSAVDSGGTPVDFDIGPDGVIHAK